MKTRNKVLMTQARGTLQGKWELAIKATLLATVIQMVIPATPIGAVIVLVAVVGPLEFGLASFWLAFARNQDPKIGRIFDGLNNAWLRSIKAFFLRTLYILLWTLLFIVPGIIASLSYSQTYFILTEDKENLRTRDILKKSKKMMRGNKWKLVGLHCRFIGWGLLCILTLGVGFLWLGPYIRVSLAKFYEDIKNGDPDSEIIKAETTPIES